MLKSFSENISTGVEVFASLTERRSKLIRYVSSRMRDQLNYYLKSKHTIGDIQQRTGVRLDKWEKEDYGKQRELYILRNLNSFLRKRTSSLDLPSADILKNETYRLISDFDANFQLEKPLEDYKLEAPWAVREKREEERRIKRVKEEARKSKLAKEKEQKYEIERMLNTGMTPLEIADQLWIDYRWDKEEMLFLSKRALAKMPEEKRKKAKLKKKRKKEAKDLEIRKGLERPEGLSEKNIIPLGENYHKDVGWY